MTSEARALADRHYDAINAGNFDEAMAVHSKDVDAYAPGMGAFSGSDLFSQFAAPFFTAFPSAKIQGDIFMESGDNTIAIEGRFSGQNTGPLMTPQGEMPPTGRSLDLHFVDIFRVRDGKVVAHHLYFDQVEFMQQLGLMPD